MRLPFVLVGALCAFGCAGSGDAERPAFVDALIAQYDADTPRSSPGSIWRYTYRDATVYYVPPACCDIPSTLYDRDGNVLCAPDGGITGNGDGRCPDFYSQRSDGVEIWRDARIDAR